MQVLMSLASSIVSTLGLVNIKGLFSIKFVLLLVISKSVIIYLYCLSEQTQLIK